MTAPGHNTPTASRHKPAAHNCVDDSLPSPPRHLRGSQPYTVAFPSLLPPTLARQPRHLTLPAHRYPWKSVWSGSTSPSLFCSSATLSISSRCWTHDNHHHTQYQHGCMVSYDTRARLGLSSYCLEQPPPRTSSWSRPVRSMSIRCMKNLTTGQQHQRRRGSARQRKGLGLPIRGGMAACIGVCCRRREEGRV